MYERARRCDRRNNDAIELARHTRRMWERFLARVQGREYVRTLRRQQMQTDIGILRLRGTETAIATANQWATLDVNGDDDHDDDGVGAKKG
jgi:hypothetical protein